MRATNNQPSREACIFLKQLAKLYIERALNILIGKHFMMVLLLAARLRRHVSRRHRRSLLLNFARYVHKSHKIMMNRVLLLRSIKQLQPRLTLAYLGTVYL